MKKIREKSQRVRVRVLAHTLWELDRTGVKASILTDCVGQLRFN
jgi:hypothetical protein